MTEEKITDLLETSMEKLKEMLKVGMIVGDPIKVGDSVIIPVARIKCGFVSGGMDQLTQSKDKTDLPFAGATAGTLNIIPIAFLASKGERVEVLHLANDTHILEKTIDGVGEIIHSLINKAEK